MDKQQFFALAEKPFPVEVPGQGKVYLRTWSQEERETLNNWWKKNPDKGAEFVARTLVLGICNVNGDSTFTDEDVGKLKSLPAKYTDFLCDQIIKHNRIDPDPNS